MACCHGYHALVASLLLSLGNRSPSNALADPLPTRPSVPSVLLLLCFFGLPFSLLPCLPALPPCPAHALSCMLFQSPKPMYIGPEGAAEARARSPRRRLSNSGSSASGSSSSLCATSPVHSPNPTPVRLDEPVAKAETRRPHPFLDPSTKTKASARPKSPGARGGKSAPKRADGHGPPSSKGVGRVSPNPVKLINQKGEPVAGVAPRVQGTAPSLSTSRRYEPPALDRDWGPLRFPWPLPGCARVLWL